MLVRHWSLGVMPLEPPRFSPWSKHMPRVSRLLARASLSCTVKLSPSLYQRSGWPKNAATSISLDSTSKGSSIRSIQFSSDTVKWALVSWWSCKAAVSSPLPWFRASWRSFYLLCPALIATRSTAQSKSSWTIYSCSAKCSHLRTELILTPRLSKTIYSSSCLKYCEPSRAAKIRTQARKSSLSASFFWTSCEAYTLQWSITKS